MRVIIARTDRLGDVVLSIPVLEAIKRVKPEWSVGYLVNPYTAPLLLHHPMIDFTIKIRVRGRNRGGIKGLMEFKRILIALRQNEIDIALVLHSKPSIALLFYLAGVPERVGISGRYYSFLYTKRVSIPKKPIHTSMRNLLFLKLIGIDSPLIPPTLFLTEEEVKRGKDLWGDSKGKRVILHTSSWTARTWPEDNFWRLAENLKERGYKVALTGRHRKKNEGIFDFGERLNLRDLMALIKNSDLLIAGSTGVLHIAAALGVPTIGLFDSKLKDHVTLWHPLGKGHLVLVPKNDLSEITPDTVMEEVSKVLGS